MTHFLQELELWMRMNCFKDDKKNTINKLNIARIIHKILLTCN